MATAWKRMGLFSAVALLAFVAVQANAAGNATTGEALFKQSCVSCHRDKPAKMMGKPVDALVAKMKHYQTMPSPTGVVAAMQKALKPWSDEQITDVAVYLNGLK